MELWSLTLEGEVKVLVIEFAMPRTIACQVPLSMEFSKQEYWRGLPFPSPGDLPNPGIKPRSPALQADSLPAELPEKPCISHRCCLPHMCACQVPSVRSDSVTLWTVAHTMVQKNL